tara:strand:+ start:11590 stop:13545 length:1956 start_codon:yes stop_codon:yes gene_type:complete
MKIDHCLFGYDNGHQLIASSLPLDAASSLLTELSDLAPGTIFGKSDGYWTGLPVASLGRYVLMKTWPAPEMSRPGCVWTHALLLEPSYLELIKDLSILKSWVVRPLKPLDKEIYRKKLDIEFSNTSLLTEPLNSEFVRELMLSLYGPVNLPISINFPGELDAPIFSVWSQQWPKLRRNFRFQTAAARFVRKSDSTRFDVTASLRSDNIYSDRIEEQNVDWLDVTVDDVLSSDESSPLRKFLWMYGCDVRLQRGSFKPLVKVRELLYSNKLHTEIEVIALVSEAFPEFNDAISLKQDLVNGELCQSAQISVIKHILSPKYMGNLFPEASTIGLSKLKALWPSKADEVLQLICYADNSKKKFAEHIVSTLYNAIATKEFWVSTGSYPNIRTKMTKNNPAFIFESEPNLDDETLIQTVPSIPHDVDGVHEFLYALLKRSSKELADCVFGNFPEMSFSAVISAMNNHDKGVSKYWKSILLQNPEILLKGTVLESVSRVSLLLELAKGLDVRSDIVMNTGVSPWCLALECSKHDIEGDDLDFFGCFLVIIACGHDDKYSPKIIESFFDIIHKRIITNALSSDARELLSHFLPNLGWFFNWDFGQRFRIFVANTYIKYQWSTEGFSSLAKNKKERAMLASSAALLEGGTTYADALWK